MGADSLGWCETGINVGEVPDGCFDSHSWHSDALSDLSSDRDDPIDSPLRLENVFIGQRSTSSSLCGSRQSKVQQSERVTDVNRYAAETYSGQSTCCRRKSPENNLDRNLSFKLCARELDSLDFQHQPSAEKQRKHDLRQDDSCLQSICTETQAEASTEFCRLKATEQCNADNFGTKANRRTDRQGARLQAQPGEGSHGSRDAETCTIHIDATEDHIETEQQSAHGYGPRLEARREEALKIVRNTSLDRFEICNDPVEAGRIVLPSVRPAEKSKTQNRCNAEHVDRRPRHRDSSRGNCNLCKKSGMYCYGAQLKAKGSCADHSCFSDEVIKQVHSSCLPVNLRPALVGDEAGGTETSGASDDLRAEPCETPDTRAAISAVDTRCSQTTSERSRRGGLPEIEPRDFASVKGAQDNAWVSGVFSHTEEFRPDGRTREGAKQTGTVNEICSTITFTTQTAACHTLDTCSNSQVSEDPKDSAQDLEGFLEWKPDRKQSSSTTLQSSQAPTKELTPNELDQKSTSLKWCLSSQLHGAKKTSPSSGLETCCDLNSRERLSYQPVRNSRFQGEEEEASCLLSDHSQDDGSWVRLSSQTQLEFSEQTSSGVFPSIVSSNHTKLTLSKIEEQPTNLAASERIHCHSIDGVDVAPEIVPSANIQTVDVCSSHCKKVSLELRFPESSSNQQSFLSLLADSNNNKASVKGAEKGDVVRCSAKGAQSSCDIIERISCPHAEPLQKVASDPVAFESVSLERSEVFSPPLDFRQTDFSGTDCQYELRNSHDRYSPLKLDAHKLRTESVEDESAADLNALGLRELRQGDSRAARYPQPEVCFNLLGSGCLETILEAERSLENCATFMDKIGVGTERESEIMRHGETLSDDAELSGEVSVSKSTEQQPEEKEPLTDADIEPAIISATATLCISGEKRHRPITVAYDTVSCNSAGSNSDATERPHLSIWARNSSSNKAAHKSKTKGNQTGNRASKFSVFAKMPSFRKSKLSKGAKIEEVSQESSDGGDEGPLCEHEQLRDNAADDISLKNEMLGQTVNEVSCSSYSELEEDDYGFFSSSASHDCQGGSEESGTKLSQSDPASRPGQTPDGQTYKRSKSNDSLNIRMRFAQAHKSLSSLFESRSTDKDGSEQAPVTAGADPDPLRQSWGTSQAADVEQLKRTHSLPDGDCRNIARGQVLRDIMSSPLVERHCGLGSPSSLRSLRHTDPISKRGVPHGCVDESSRGCVADGHTMLGSPPSPFNDSAVLSPSSTSPVSHPNHGVHSTPAHQVSPSWTRSHPGTADDLAKSPLRPMSPKPNSPRPASQRKSFCFSHSARLKSLSPVSLPQSVSIDGLTDPPKRPKTLKPSSSPLCLSFNPLDAADSRMHSQSHIRLYANGFINELEVRQMLFLS